MTDTSPRTYFEDVVPGEHIFSTPYRVPEEELIAFGKKWDPLPMHTDRTAAEASAFGGLIAPGSYVIAIIINRVHSLPQKWAVIASPGYDEVRFLNPVRPGDDLILEVEVVDKRVSESKPDRGIVILRFTLRNQLNTPVCSLLNAVLMYRTGFGG